MLAAWYDLSHMKVGAEPLEFVSPFDDTMDVWSDSDFRLVENFVSGCAVVGSGRFERVLEAAA